jgi:hypothetical protein
MPDMQIQQVVLLGLLGLSSIGAPTAFSIRAEIFSTALRALHLVGVWAAIGRMNSAIKVLPGNELRLLCVGLGWSVAESATHYAPALWIGARGMEFSWEYLHMGVSANIDLFVHLAFVTAVFLISRRDAEAALLPVSVAIAAACLVLPSAACFLSFAVGLPLTAVFAARAAAAAVLALAARTAFRRFDSQQKLKLEKQK